MAGSTETKERYIRGKRVDFIRLSEERPRLLGVLSRCTANRRTIHDAQHRGRQYSVVT